jgi:L-fucose isomerase-like protein
MNKGIKLGLAPTRRFVFSVEDAHAYKKKVEEKLRGWNVDLVNIDGINDEGLLFSRNDVDRAVELLRRAKVDAVFVPHVNFGTEEVVAAVARGVGKPLLLWGPRDEAPLPSGHRLRDTQCGLFATSNVLKKYGVPFSYIVNSRLDSPVFERGFKNFLRAARAATRFLGARIGQIDTRPPNFYTVMINEQDLLARWGIEMVPVGLTVIEKNVKALLKNDPRVKELAESIRKRIALHGIADDVLHRIAALKLALQDWAEADGLAAIAFKCHEDLQRSLGIYPCFINGELATEMGVPVTCETDIHGALTAVLLHNASDTHDPIFFADLTVRHPTNDNAELLWHCGNFPYALADKEQPKLPTLGTHFVIPPYLPGTSHFRLKKGDVTMARFDGMNGHYSLLMGHGRGVDGPHNLGTYLWVEVPDWPLWEERIIEGPYIHHVAATYDKVAPALYEATRFIPGLRPDPVQPTLDEIKAYLRGSRDL